MTPHGEREWPVLDLREPERAGSVGIRQEVEGIAFFGSKTTFERQIRGGLNKEMKG